MWEALYATSHDVLVIGRDGPEAEDRSGLPFHPGFLKPGMTVVDLTAGEEMSPFLREAADRRSAVVAPGRLLVEQVREHARRHGADVSAETLTGMLATWLPDE
jgi:hypothetical protein